MMLFLTPFFQRGTIHMSELTKAILWANQTRKPHTIPRTDGSLVVEHHQGFGVMKLFADRLGALNQSMG
jgi:hypothetical protein